MTLRSIFLLTMVLSITVWAQREILPLKATEKTLPNGLKVIVVPTGFPNIVSLQIPVKTGSRNEIEPGKSGFAHFFEHMMFRGTKQYPADKYQEILTKIGARQNAYTTDDYTNYHTTFAKEDLELMLKIEADRFMNLDYSEEDFKTEARAVLGEYNKSIANPIMKLLEVQQNSAFQVHTYKHTTIGFLKDIEDMPNQFEYSKVFFDRWYRPENTAIIVAGDVEPNEVIALVEKYWAKWQPGTYRVQIPQEPPQKAPIYEHVSWPTKTLPIVTVAFRSPAFSDVEKDYAAIEMAMSIYFGSTSEIYRRLVEQERKVDLLAAYAADNEDPALTTIIARLKDPADAVYVRDLIIETLAKARATEVDEALLNEAKSNARYSFLRRLDNTEAIAAMLARYVRYNRSFETVNNLYRVYDSLTPQDLRQVIAKYVTDNALVVTTLSHEPLSDKLRTNPKLADYEAKFTAVPDIDIIVQRSALPQINFKIAFKVGSMHDPVGKEGLAALSASMIARAGSKLMTIDQINKVYFPIAASFDVSVDREMTTFTGVVHADNLDKFLSVALAQLTDPGFRNDDFQRLKENQLNSLLQDLRSNNEEELGKERLQENIFRGTPYGHTTLGTVEGLRSITLDDVRDFIAKHYTKANLIVGASGNFPDSFLLQLKRAIGRLPEGKPSTMERVTGRMPEGIEVEIIEKDSLATAISFGFPIEVNRSHPDFAALWLARAWFGEHRSSVSHLYQRIREIRGMNYGDYAYIEAFPGGMYSFFPPTGVARRSQIFEVWLRPVVPINAQMALRIAIYELDKLVKNGLTKEQFEQIREYLMKNVYVMTATQDQQLGYAIDSKFYGIGEYTSYMRSQLEKLTLDDVNSTIRRHLSSKNLFVVMVTKDAEGLKEALLKDEPSTMKYEAPKPKELLEEDAIIGAMKLNIRNIKVTKVDEVFVK
ncbi:MAG: pitrilysin family protein [Acidobacteriota bacterium]|nr:pitrilysin family protein [Acidobacteriota bacterium]